MRIAIGRQKLLTIAAGGSLAAAMALAVPLSGPAGATASVTLNPTPPSGGYTNGQTITVSGTGFSTRSSGNTITIVECADPGGGSAGLPQDNTTCDATTENPGTIFPDSSGNFSASYQIVKLTTSGGNLINCDSSDNCVLWVGEDFNSNFSGSTVQPTAFSQSFLVADAVTGTPESPLTVALPIVGASVVGAGGFFTYRRRRRNHVGAA